MIPTNEELIQKWNRFSSQYSQKIAEGMLPMGLSMFNVVCGERSDRILDISCGSGELATEIILKKKPNAEYVGVDISPSMCLITKLKLEKLSEILNSGNTLGYYQQVHGIHEIPEGMVWKSGAIAKFPTLKAEVHHGNAEDLSFFADSSFDSIISCLTLHIVPEPAKFLKECYRLLSPGKRAVFSVWGHKDISFTHSLFDEALVEFKIPNSGKRDSWHLNDRVKLQELAESAGFKDILIWDQTVPRKLETPEEQRLSTEVLQELRWPDKETLKAANEYIISREDGIVREKKMPIALNCMFLCVKKP